MSYCLGCGVPTDDNPQYELGLYFVGCMCDDCLAYKEREDRKGKMKLYDITYNDKSIDFARPLPIKPTTGTVEAKCVNWSDERLEPSDDGKWRVVTAVR